MVRFLIVGFTILGLVSCSPTRIAIDKAEMSRLQTEPAIHAVTYSSTAFYFTSAGDLATTAFAVGAVGVLAAVDCRVKDGTCSAPVFTSSSMLISAQGG